MKDSKTLDALVSALENYMLNRKPGMTPEEGNKFLRELTQYYYTKYIDNNGNM